MKKLRLGLIGTSKDNGHPYSWSAIINGYDKKKIKNCGYTIISNYLNKKYTFEECVDKGQQVTRNYVKRQLTWWRSSSLPIDQVFNDFANNFDENLIKN